MRERGGKDRYGRDIETETAYRRGGREGGREG